MSHTKQKKNNMLKSNHQSKSWEFLLRPKIKLKLVEVCIRASIVCKLIFETWKFIPNYHIYFNHFNLVSILSFRLFWLHQFDFCSLSFQVPMIQTDKVVKSYWYVNLNNKNNKKYNNNKIRKKKNFNSKTHSEVWEREDFCHWISAIVAVVCCEQSNYRQRPKRGARKTFCVTEKNTK